MDPCTNVHVLGIADPVAAATHLFGVAASACLGVQLWKRTKGDPRRRASTLIFAISTGLLFAASTAYHTIAEEPTRGVLRRLDHAMIYVLIAGTFTPIVAHLVQWDRLRHVVLGIVWTLAVLGVGFKSFFFNSTPEWVDVTLYIAMGWFGIVPFASIVQRVPWRSVALVPFAGVTYSLGALSELVGWPVIAPGVFGFHEVFHVAVLVASFSFYVFIAKAVVEDAPDGQSSKEMLAIVDPNESE